KFTCIMPVCSKVTDEILKVVDGEYETVPANNPHAVATGSTKPTFYILSPRLAADNFLRILYL
ncbi:hypothetical protein, partial [Dryocola boscaweniae]